MTSRPIRITRDTPVHSHIRLPIVKSADGQQCASDCPHFAAGRDGWNDTCRWADGYRLAIHGRHPACIDAERAANEDNHAEGGERAHAAAAEREVTELRAKLARVRAACAEFGEPLARDLAADVLAIIDEGSEG